MSLPKQTAALLRTAEKPRQRPHQPRRHHHAAKTPPKSPHPEDTTEKSGPFIGTSIPDIEQCPALDIQLRQRNTRPQSQSRTCNRPGCSPVCSVFSVTTVLRVIATYTAALQARLQPRLFRLQRRNGLACHYRLYCCAASSAYCSSVPLCLFQ